MNSAMEIHTEHNAASSGAATGSRGHNSGMPAVILAGICWGAISPFVRALAAAGFGSLDIMCFRTWTAAVLLFLWLLLKDRKKLRIRIQDLWMFAGSGIVSLTFFSFCYFTTIVNAGTAVAVVLLYTSPIFVMLLSAVFFRERITRRKTAALVMTFSGCILVAGLLGGTGQMSPAGFLTGIGAGVGYALYSIFAGFAVRRYESLTVSFYTFVFSGISLFFFRSPRVLFASAGPELLPCILGIAVVCTVIPYIAYTFGLMRMEKSKAAVLVTVEPLCGTLLGLLVYREPCDAAKLLGIVLIFAAVVLLSLPGTGTGDEA